MELWRLLAPYLVAGATVAFFAWVVVRSLLAKPPTSAPMVVHLVIAIGMAFVLLYILVDTRRLDDVPPFRWQGKLIAIDRRLDTVERALFEGYKTERFRIKDGVATGGAKVEPSSDEAEYPWRLTLPLEREAVPNSVQSWENGVSTQPQRISVEGTMLTLKMYYDPRPDTEVVVRYYPRGQ